jgi:S-adenosylmethionine decarboxylase
MDERLAARHLIVELGGCDAARLDDPECIRKLLREGAACARTRLLSEVVHRFEPMGVTGIALLAESHLAVHTWPERRAAAVDLFTCHAGSDLERVVEFLRSALQASTARVRIVERHLA